jgi:hypothetical protein
MMTEQSAVEPQTVAPVEPNAIEFFQAENVELRAIIAARDAADAAAAVGLAIDDPKHPARCYLPLAEAAYQAAVGSKTAWRWHSKKLVFGFKAAGTGQILICKNDLIDHRLKRGRHCNP